MKCEFRTRKHGLWTTSNTGKELLVRTLHSGQNSAETRGPFGVSVSTFLAIVLLATSGCQVLTYGGPNGEHFSRCSFGATTSFSSLLVEATTNGLRRLELRGYTNDSTSALGTVTEAAVRAAIHGAR